jgi:hypothetical protein
MARSRWAWPLGAATMNAEAEWRMKTIGDLVEK